MTDPTRDPVGARLATERLSVAYGGVVAVDDLNLVVRPGEICGLIGPNGSGKSTALAALSRLVRPRSGRLLWEGREYTSIPPTKVARLGIARTFQTVRLVSTLSVVENVLVGADRLDRGIGFFETLLFLPGYRRHERAGRDRALHALSRVGLADLADVRPTTLPYGKQRRVELARALLGSPALLLLDEPTAGMSEAERDEIAELLKGLAADGLSVVLVEHNLRFINSICDWVYVMNAGRCIASGPASEVGEDPAVVAAYLGRRES